jgi:DNA invertase Pin-like site-specific DNA recombinase/predicted DNA-binding protein (UPF0251 family)
MPLPESRALQREIAMVRQMNANRPIVAGSCGPATLTARQAEVLNLAVSGLSGKQIARHLGISARTVQDHISRMRQRTGARSEAELVAYAVSAGALATGTALPSRCAGQHETGSQDAGERVWQHGAEKRKSANVYGASHKPACNRCRELASEINVGERPSDTFRHMIMGYACVSTADQNPNHQIDSLLRAGVDRENIHVDEVPGAKTSRPALDFVLKLLREGDTLTVTRLDRLSRSVLHLITLGAELRERGVGLHVIEQDIDTATMEGRAMFGMLSVLAELQHELIMASKKDGLAAARARGRIGGRPTKLTPVQAALAQQLYDAREKTVQQIADIFNVPRSTMYGHLNRATQRFSSANERPAANRS